MPASLHTYYIPASTYAAPSLATFLPALVLHPPSLHACQHLCCTLLQSMPVLTHTTVHEQDTSLSTHLYLQEHTRTHTHSSSI